MIAMFIFLTVYVSVVLSLVYRGRKDFETHSRLPLDEGDMYEQR